MNKDEALKLALAGITKVPTLTHGLLVKLADVEAAIKEALAQPEPKSKFPLNDSFERDEAAQARVREFMRNH